MSSLDAVTWGVRRWPEWRDRSLRALESAVTRFCCLAFEPIHLLLAWMAVVMFVHEAVNAPPFDRALFFLLVVTFCLFWWVGRLPVAATRTILTVVGLMGALTGLAVWGALQTAYNAQTWSFIASKYVVPYSLFVIGTAIFQSRRAVRLFFGFCFAAAGYLVFTALAQVLGLDVLVFPRYILDPELGLHLNRARGPFLQGVANGTAILLLGLCVGYWRTEGRLEDARRVLLILLPVAVVGTMTRAVWLAFAVLVGLLLLYPTAIGRRVGARLGTACVVLAGGLLLVPAVQEIAGLRLADQGAVEIRFALYGSSLDMFWDRPWFGWGMNQMPLHIPDYMYWFGYDVELITPHNTYLEILVEHGLVGMLLFAGIIFGLFRAGWKLPATSPRSSDWPVDRRFLPFWYGMLVVYLINAFFVAMNYEFVNAFLFLVAGMLYAAELRHRDAPRRVVRADGAGSPRGRR